jgi:hypothetical protein
MLGSSGWELALVTEPTNSSSNQLLTESKLVSQQLSIAYFKNSLLLNAILLIIL